MKNLNQTQFKIMSALSNGECQSGNHLAALLGISRTAIWKNIKQLVAIGVPIQSSHQGYQLLNAIILLNAETIHSKLAQFKLDLNFKMHIISLIDSTNYFLKNLPKSTLVEVCCAETQTHGRGRFSRTWHSPFGENLYCSSRWNFNCDLSLMSGLSLVVSLAIVKTLHDIGINDHLLIKWPNDVLWQHQKLCGCLIEVSAESNGSVEVIIGIGMNVNMIQSTELQTSWCSLTQITQQHWDRNHIAAYLLKNLTQFLHEFIAKGFTVFLERWEQVDYLRGQNITVSNPQGSITGIAQGINESGQLLLQHDKYIHTLSVGDTTLSKNSNI